MTSGRVLSSEVEVGRRSDHNPFLRNCERLPALARTFAIPRKASKDGLHTSRKVSVSLQQSSASPGKAGSRCDRLTRTVWRVIQTVGGFVMKTDIRATSSPDAPWLFLPHFGSLSYGARHVAARSRRSRRCLPSALRPRGTSEATRPYPVAILTAAPSDGYLAPVR